MLYEHRKKFIAAIIAIFVAILFVLFVLPTLPKEQHLYGISSSPSYELNNELYIQFIQKSTNEAVEEEYTYFLKEADGSKKIAVNDIMSDENDTFNKAAIIDPNELDLGKIYELYISNGNEEQPILQAKTYDEMVDVGLYKFTIGGNTNLLILKETSESNQTEMYDYKIVDQYVRDDLEVGYFSISVKNEYVVAIYSDDKDVIIERLNKKRVGDIETKYFFTKKGNYQKEVEVEIYLMTKDEQEKVQNGAITYDDIQKKYTIKI